jgi:hypothetical protein
MALAQQQVIQKGVASELGLMEGMESFARDGGTKRLREVIAGMVEDQTVKIETGTASGGLGFRLLKITNAASGKLDRARSIEATVSELQSHLTEVVDLMKDTGRMWEGGAASRIVGYGQGSMQEIAQRVSDFTAAINADPTRQLLEKDIINIVKEMGVESPTETHASKFIEETLEDWKDISRQTLDQSQGPGMQAKTQHPIGAASKIWNWFKAPYKEGTFHYAKRVGAVASVGLVGASIMTNLLIPRVVSHEPRESSYVDIAPNLRGMGPIRDLGHSVTSGGGMPAVYPYMGDVARAPVHPVRIGPGMGPQRGMPPAPMPDGMAPLPPADYWSLTDAPRAMSSARPADTGQTRIHVSSNSGMRRSIGKRQRPDMMAQTVSTNRFLGAGLTEIPLDIAASSGYTTDGQGVPPFGGFPLPVGRG